MPCANLEKASVHTHKKRKTLSLLSLIYSSGEADFLDVHWLLFFPSSALLFTLSVCVGKKRKTIEAKMSAPCILGKSNLWFTFLHILPSQCASVCSENSLWNNKHMTSMSTPLWPVYLMELAPLFAGLPLHTSPSFILKNDIKVFEILRIYCIYVGLSPHTPWPSTIMLHCNLLLSTNTMTGSGDLCGHFKCLTALPSILIKLIDIYAGTRFTSGTTFRSRVRCTVCGGVKRAEILHSYRSADAVKSVWQVIGEFTYGNIGASSLMGQSSIYQGLYT